MRIIYSDRYRIDIGPHVFPTAKYGFVRAALLDQGVVSSDDFLEPEPASWEDLALVHTREFLEKARCGSLTREEVARLEMPWTESMVDGFRLMAGGTLLAARIARGDGRDTEGGWRVAVHLGGGFHHAFADHGEGFCLFNDVAVALKALQRDRAIARAAIVDVDVHHGNGTASIVGGDPSVFSFSIHQQNNYPAVKPPGSLDIGMADGAGDADVLGALRRALPAALASRPDLLFYVAGADPYEADQLGGLRMTRHGLRRRDRLVLESACDARVPVVIVLAGGYARNVDDTVAIHAATIEEAKLLSES